MARFLRRTDPVTDDALHCHSHSTATHSLDSVVLVITGIMDGWLAAILASCSGTLASILPSSPASSEI